jgi:hypothetical protein
VPLFFKLPYNSPPKIAIIKNHINQRNQRLKNDLPWRSRVNQMRSRLKAKIHFLQKFFAPFLTSSYENRQSQIKNLFRIKRACSPLLREGGIISKHYEKTKHGFYFHLFSFYFVFFVSWGLCG